MTRESRFAGLRRVVRLPGSTRSLGREVDDEIRFHIESHVAELVARGVPVDEARERALSCYGDLSASRRELLRVDRARLFRERWAAAAGAFIQDVSFALRLFRARPGFAFASVLVFALGIGANATMFGIVDRLLLRPPAHIADPSRVMMIRYVRTTRGQTSAQDALSFPIYLDLRATPGAFAGVAAYTGTSLAVGRGADARRVDGARVSAGFFQLLGVRPRLGRFFLPEDDGDPVAPNVAVISSVYWKREYGSDAGVLGRTMPIGDAQFTIIGVAPAGFAGVGNDVADIWIPFTAVVTPAEYDGWRKSRDGYWLNAVVRLAGGVSRDVAAAAATRRLQESMRHDGTSDEWIAARRPSIGFVSVLPREAHAGDAIASVAALLTAVSFVVLLIACANVANLQLARGIARRREIAVRVALGVSRRRLLGQLLTESVVLAAAGGMAALLVAYWGSGFVERVLFGSSNFAGASTIDARVLVYTALSSILVGLLSGVMPALHAGRASITSELKDGARHGGGSRQRARATLLVVQTMLSIVLLVGTGLFVSSLRRIDAVPLGLEPKRTLVVTMQTSGMRYTPTELSLLYQRLLETARHDPSVNAAALALTLPFSTSWAGPVHIPGRDSLPRVADGGPYMNAVTTDFFRTVGTRLLSGRGFTEADQPDAPRVVVINESLARLWWPDGNAIGKCMIIGADTNPCSEVVGIVEDARRQGILEGTSVQYFIPQAQSVANTNVPNVLLVRPRTDAVSAAESIRRILQQAAPNLPYVRVRPLEDLVAPQKRSWRLGATMFAVFGALALVLAAVGLYSVLAYDVAQRTREFGVRVAVGAEGSDVMALVFRRGLRTTVIGGAAGLLVALVAGPMVKPLLFQTSPRDPLVFGAALGVVLVIAVLAALIPARRALGVDPIVALRAN